MRIERHNRWTTDPKTGILVLLLLALAPMLALTACGGGTPTATSGQPSTTAAGDTGVAPTTTAAPDPTGPAGQTTLILASTTSTQDSGLFDMLIPAFAGVYPQYEVKVVAVGSGEALKLGETGDADVLLVHSPAAEQQFMADGFGVERKAVMYNDYIVVGAPADPASVKGITVAADAFKKIAESGSLFYSRGDRSGTHSKEWSIWKAAALTPDGDWYQTTGQGMGETLTISDQKGGYTLADRGTWLSKKGSLTGLTVLVEGDEALFNQYHVVTCKGAKNMQGATDFMNWVVSAEAQQDVIAKFGVERFGQALFVPNAED